MTDFLNVFDFIDHVNDCARSYIEKNMTETNARELGLDPRAAYTMYVDENCVAVSSHCDRTLQYYGGFEYIDSEFRHSFGDYVFYTAEDDRDNCRVRKCIDRFFKNQDQDEDEDVD